MGAKGGGGVSVDLDLEDAGEGESDASSTALSLKKLTHLRRHMDSEFNLNRGLVRTGSVDSDLEEQLVNIGIAKNKKRL
jgi:hypothetical protein